MGNQNGKTNLLIAPSGAQGALYFLDGQYLFQHANGNGVSAKFISAVSARRAFSNEPIDSGWLPPGVNRWGTGARNTWMVRWHEPALYRISIEDQKRALVVPMPSLIWMGYGSLYYLWAARAEKFDPKAALYHAPIPNLDDFGRVCFGQNPHADVAKGGFEQAWQLFWQSAFNDHHANGKSKVHKTDVRLQLKKVAKGAKKYPLDDLISMNRSLQSAVDQLAREETARRAAGDWHTDEELMMDEMDPDPEDFEE